MYKPRETKPPDGINIDAPALANARAAVTTSSIWIPCSNPSWTLNLTKREIFATFLLIRLSTSNETLVDV